jgi:hypothetical protein
MHFNRKGEPIDIDEWSRLFSDRDYQRLASTHGCGRHVSTVWLGLDHNFSGKGPPIIFETLVFKESETEDEPSSLGEIDGDRYATEAEALAGHQRLCEQHAYILDRIVDKVFGPTKLWSIQSAEAYEEINTTGRIVGDWNRIDDPLFAPAYRWLVQEMTNRSINLEGRPPVWAWAKKPDLRQGAHLPRGTKGVRIELDVPSNQVLLSDYAGWHSVLNNHFMALTDEEMEKAFADPPVYLQDDVQRSWLRIFDLSLFPDGVAQATFPSIERQHIVDVRPFVAR